MFTHPPTEQAIRLTTRIGTSLPVLASTFAITFAILILALLSAGRTAASTAPITAAPAYVATAATTTRPPCYFRDPATHALLRIPRPHGRCRRRTAEPT